MPLRGYGTIPYLFGDGSDGNVTISGGTTLTRDMYYKNLTINAGIVLNNGGYRIFVSRKLTMGNAAQIKAPDGNNGGNGNTGGTGGLGGTVPTNGSLGIGFAGGRGGPLLGNPATAGASSDAVFGMGGSGGGGGGSGAAGANGGSSGGTSGGSGALGGGNVGGTPSAQPRNGFRSPFALLNPGWSCGAFSGAASYPLGWMCTPLLGGAGGGGGGAGGGTGEGGGGGAGGNVLVVAAQEIILGSSCVFKAIGGNGGNGSNATSSTNGAGAGGGGGGLILIYCNKMTGTPTFNVAGGSGGAPGGGAGGSGGFSGASGGDGNYFVFEGGY